QPCTALKRRAESAIVIHSLWINLWITHRKWAKGTKLPFICRKNKILSTPKTRKDFPLKIKLLVIQRVQPYPNAYLPEILSVVDEVTLDDNPEWWDEEVEKQLALVGEDDIDSWAILSAEIPIRQIEQALYPDDDLTITEDE